MLISGCLASCAAGPVQDGARRSFPRVRYAVLMPFRRFCLYPVAWAPVSRGHRGTVPGAPFPIFLFDFRKIAFSNMLLVPLGRRGTLPGAPCPKLHLSFLMSFVDFVIFSITGCMGPCAAGPVGAGARRSCPKLFLCFSGYPVAWAPMTRGRRRILPGAPFLSFSSDFLKIYYIRCCLGPGAAGLVRNEALSSFPKLWIRIFSTPGCLCPCTAGPARDRGQNSLLWLFLRLSPCVIARVLVPRAG